MKLRIFNYDYYNILENKYDPELVCPVLVICGRDEGGDLHTIKIAGNEGIFRPHFYIDATDENVMLCEQYKIAYEDWKYPTIYNENDKVLICYKTFPYEVRRIREYFPRTYEADVPYHKMFMMKLNLNGGYLECPDKEWVTPDEVKPIPEEEHFYVKPRVFYWDIETDFIDPEKRFAVDNQQMISMVVYDNYTNHFWTFEWDSNHKKEWAEDRIVENRFKHTGVPITSDETIVHCTSEKNMLKGFFRLFINRPDALFTFNGHGGNELVSIKSKSQREWHNGFDEPVLHSRALHFGLNKEMQWMSPLPRVKTKFGRYYGVYKRGREEKYEVVIRGLTPLDFYYAAPKMQYTVKYRDFFGRSLDAYLKYFGKFGKIGHEGLTVAEFKKADLYGCLLYNRIDVEGCFFLDQRFGFSDDIFDTVSISKLPGADVLSATKIHDFLILDQSQNYCVYDTKYQHAERDKWKGFFTEKQGGYNIPIKRGISGWTAIFDFSGLYPNLSSAANAGIDTLIHVDKEYDDHYIDINGKKWLKKDVICTPSGPFRKDKISIEKQVWDYILGVREKYKKRLEVIFEENGGNTKDPMYKLYWSKQYNLKTRLINNKYGASGNKGFRNYCLAVYNVPPSMAQVLIKELEKTCLPHLGYKTNAGDTDSVMVKISSTNIKSAITECEFLAKKMNQFINKLLNDRFNIQKHNITLDWEKIGPKFYGHKKKNYLMEVWAQDGKILSEKNRYIMFKGFIMKKRNRATVTETIQRVYFKVALESKDKEAFLINMTEVIKRVEKIFPYINPEKLCSRINIRRKLQYYEPNFVNRRAAESSNHIFGTNYGIGSHGYLAWLKNNGNHKLKKVIMFKEKEHKRFKDYNLVIDYDHHKQKFVIDKFDLLLEDYNTSYYKLLRASKITSTMVL